MNLIWDHFVFVTMFQPELKDSSKSILKLLKLVGHDAVD